MSYTMAIITESYDPCALRISTNSSRKYALVSYILFVRAQQSCKMLKPPRIRKKSKAPVIYVAKIPSALTDIFYNNYFVSKT
jgi:hypothetical protein